MSKDKVTGIRLNDDDRKLLREIGIKHTNNDGYTPGVRWLLNYYRKTISSYKGI